MLRTALANLYLARFLWKKFRCIPQYCAKPSETPLHQSMTYICMLLWEKHLSAYFAVNMLSVALLISLHCQVLNWLKTIGSSFKFGEIIKPILCNPVGLGCRSCYLVCWLISLLSIKAKGFGISSNTHISEVVLWHRLLWMQNEWDTYTWAEVQWIKLEDEEYFNCTLCASCTHLV